jgi:hypothetical protein
VYLKDKTPLIACHYCLGSFGAAIPASQMDPNHLVEAQKEVHDNPISLIDPKIDLKDPPEPQNPKPGWIREGFETLQNFLERVEKSGKSIEEFVR